MNTTLSGRFSTYIVERGLHVQSDVEDEEVVTYVYAAPTDVEVLGQPETGLITVIRTPLIEMALDEQHQRVVHDILDGVYGWE